MVMSVEDLLSVVYSEAYTIDQPSYSDKLSFAFEESVLKVVQRSMDPDFSASKSRTWFDMLAPEQALKTMVVPIIKINFLYIFNPSVMLKTNAKLRGDA